MNSQVNARNETDIHALQFGWPPTVGPRATPYLTLRSGLPSFSDEAAKHLEQAGRWKSTRMPLQHVEKFNAARSGMAKFAAATGRDEPVSE